ncbi:FAD:protein FMN transferase, partial [Patescibacteria group bacterium]|nr:FAD:protein FMN transferase [Patescibacteria group bacterium]
DLGGIGKGFLVDKLVNIIRAKEYKNFWVSAGGDMYLYGLAENNEPHQIGIQNPLDLEKDIIHVQVPEKGLAIATSGIAKRQWIKNGRSYHHLIDPRTGLSTDNNLLAVTIVANTVIEADIFAKTVFILGQEQGLSFINEYNGIEGLLINKGNKIIPSQNMSDYLIKGYK